MVSSLCLGRRLDLGRGRRQGRAGVAGGGAAGGGPHPKEEPQGREKAREACCACCTGKLPG